MHATERMQDRGCAAMSRVGVPVGPRFIFRRAILELLTAGREVRTLPGGPTRAAEVPAMVGTTTARLAVRVSFVASQPDHAGWLDAVAGCEYVDDRIRLAE
jgi:hypothetical protein